MASISGLSFEIHSCNWRQAVLSTLHKALLLGCGIYESVGRNYLFEKKYGNTINRHYCTRDGKHLSVKGV